MFTKLFRLMLLLILLLSSAYAKEKPTLLFYCGISMVKPIREISKIIEKRYNCNIKISQGGSRDLYDALKLSKTGDLYLPGSKSYRTKNLKDGLLLDAQYVGYNKAAIFVQKGNPKHIKGLNSLVDENIATVLCDPQTGSIGKMTKEILLKFKGEDFFNDAFDMAIEIETDSRNLNRALREKIADMTISWRATAFFDENRKFIDTIEIDDKYAPKKSLVINLLSFSKHKDIATAFMKFASSKEGQKIMKKYGFL